MTELTVKVLKQLKTIFPHYDEGLLLIIINNPDHRTGILTLDTLVVRCVEQILEGEEAAEKRLKNAEEDKTAILYRHYRIIIHEAESKERCFQPSYTAIIGLSYMKQNQKKPSYTAIIGLSYMKQNQKKPSYTAIIGLSYMKQNQKKPSYTAIIGLSYMKQNQKKPSYTAIIGLSYMKQNQKKGQKKPGTSATGTSCLSDSVRTAYREEDQASNDGASAACCSDISIIDSHLDVSQSPKSSSSFGISSLTLDFRDEKRNGPALGQGEGQSGVMTKDWLAKHAKTDEEDRISDSAADACSQTAVAAVVDDSSCDGRLTPTASPVGEDSISTGRFFDTSSNSEIEIISLKSGADTSLDCWSEESQNEGCKTPCNNRPEDFHNKESESGKDTGESDNDTATVKAFQDNVDFLSTDTFDSQLGSSHQDMDSPSNSPEDPSDIPVADGGHVLSDGDISAEGLTEKKENIVIDISDVSNTPVKSEDSVIDISDIVELESPVRQPKLTDSLFNSVDKELRSSVSNVSVDPLDLNNAEDDIDTDDPVMPTLGKADLKVENLQPHTAKKFASVSNQLCNRVKRPCNDLLIDSNSKATGEYSTLAVQDLDSGTSGSQSANQCQTHVEQRYVHSPGCVVTSSDSDVPQKQSPCTGKMDSLEDIAPIQSFQISSNSADKESDILYPVSNLASLSHETSANISQNKNSEKNRVIGVKKGKNSKCPRFLEHVKRFNKRFGAPSVLFNETRQVEPISDKTYQFSSGLQNVSYSELTLPDGQSGSKGQNNESDLKSEVSLQSQQTTQPMTLPDFDLSLPNIPLPVRGESVSDRIRRIQERYAASKSPTQFKIAKPKIQISDTNNDSQPLEAFKSVKHQTQLSDTNNDTKQRESKHSKHQARIRNANIVERRKKLADANKELAHMVAEDKIARIQEQWKVSEIRESEAMERVLNKLARSIKLPVQVPSSAVEKDLENRTCRAELSLSSTAMRERDKLQTPQMTTMSTDSATTTGRMTVKAPSTMVTEKVPIVMTFKREMAKTPTQEQDSSMSYRLSSDRLPGAYLETKPDLLPESLVLGSMDDLESNIQQVTVIFPDVDVNWARTELRSMKARYPDDFLDHMCSMMADSGYMKAENNSSSKSKTGECSTGGGKRKSVNVKGSLGKIKSAQRYVDVLSEIGEEAETLKRFARKRQLEEAMDVTDVVPAKLPAMIEGNAPGVKNTEPEENTSSDSVFRLQCESCKMLASTTNLTQCCEGHLLCKTCVEQCVKKVLTLDNKTTIICSLAICTSEIRLADAKKVLPQFVVDMLQEKIDKQERSSINRMSNIVSCPDCGVSVMMETLDKQFHCPNTDCMLASCRYCKREWNGSRHNYCNPFLSVPSLEECTHYPKHWDPIGSDFTQDFLKVVVPFDSMEFLHISDHFKRSMHHFRIVRLTRIQNPKLWQKYGLTRSHILEDFGPGKLNENHLFHGTDPNVVEAICREGFDWRLCGRHGVAFGQGSYFAVEAEYSHKYAVSVRSHFTPTFAFNQGAVPPMGIQVLLLARVVCGRYTMGTPHLRRPPPDPSDVKKRPFNSVVNNLRKPSIYVTFDSCQTYPEYVIEYDRENFVNR